MKSAVMLSPTLRPSIFTLASYFLVPIIMSVLLLFRCSLSLIIQIRIACMHCSVASTASFCEKAESALNDRYSCVLSVYTWDCGKRMRGIVES